VVSENGDMAPSRPIRWPIRALIKGDAHTGGPGEMAPQFANPLPPGLPSTWTVRDATMLRPFWSTRQRSRLFLVAASNAPVVPPS
jgi:hypothetical protein